MNAQGKGGKSPDPERKPKKSRTYRVKSGDTVYVRFNAYKDSLGLNPIIPVHQNGIIIFEVTDINLFRYKVSHIQVQDNIVNSTPLSEDNDVEIEFDPSAFNLTSLDLNIPILTYKNTEIVKNITNYERDILGKKGEILEVEKSLDQAKNDIKVLKQEVAKYKALEEDRNRAELKRDDLIETKEVGSQFTEDQEADLAYYSKLVTDINNKLKEFDGAKIKDFEDRIAIFETKTEPDFTFRIKSLTNSLRSFENQRENAVRRDNSNNAKIRDFDQVLEAYQSAIHDLNKLSELYVRLVANLFQEGSRIEIENERDKIIGDFFGDSFPDILMFSRDDILDQSYERLNQVLYKYYDLNKEYNKYAGDVKQIDVAFEKIKIFNEQINRASYQPFFLELAKVFDATDPKFFTLKFRLSKITDNADLVNFQLRGEPQKKVPGSIVIKPITIDYNVRIVRGVKIDVSTGLFFNIGVNNSDYRFVDGTEESTTMVVEDESKSLFSPSIGFLFHVYPRSVQDVKLGGNIGFSTDTEQLNFYLGASLLLGKSERISVNFGLVGSQVNKPSGEFTPGTIIQQPVSELPSEIPLRSPAPYRIGAYMGVSFNLIGNKNKQSLSQVTKL